MKKLLVLGTGKDQVFGIEKAIEMGLYTIGLDMNELSDGAKFVDEFYKINIKNDGEVVDFLKNYNRPIDGVIAFGVDIPDILAKAAELRNLPYYTNYKTACISKDKYLAKERMKGCGVDLPIYRKIKNFDELKQTVKDFGYPCVLKPTDNSGARGVLRLTEDIDLRWAFENSISFSGNKRLILEEFLDGVQLSTESFIVDGKVYTVGIAERNYEFLEKFSPYIVENGGDLPPELTDEQRGEIDGQILKCAKAFDVKNGIIKGDLVLHGGKIFIIEVALRLSGGHFSSIEIPLNTGVDFLKYAILMSLNEAIETDELVFKLEKYVSLRYIFPYKKGIIKNLEFPEWFEKEDSIKAYDFYYKLGEVANYPVKSHPERLGFFLVASRNYNELKKMVEQAYQDTVVEIE